MKNALAYFTVELITTIESFIVKCANVLKFSQSQFMNIPNKLVCLSVASLKG